MHQIQIDGEAARAQVRKAWPEATSAYVGATAAEVYDPVTATVLGRSDACDFSVELAWVEAARFVQKTE